MRRLLRRRGRPEPSSTRPQPDGPRRIVPVLQLRDAVKEYPGAPPVRALDGVSLDVVSGEMVAVVGPSGSGKSTLLHMIGALDRPSTGIVRVAGSDLSRLSDPQLSALRARRIGFVFQRFHLLSGLTAEDNVATGLVYRGVPSGERRERATRALEQVGLAKRATHRPTELSGGEQQRVAIARAIVGGPAIVLADEPTGNLDSATGGEILDVFGALHAGGTTIVLITHDASVAAHAPRVIALRDGRVAHDSRRDGAAPAGQVALSGAGTGPGGTL
ncbi:MAG TPA: ABC transporter ATP-binding protein [Acidimicrobiales bacterium]|jgi:putative ABC transport system ATP-binding protein